MLITLKTKYYISLELITYRLKRTIVTLVGEDNQFIYMIENEILSNKLVDLTVTSKGEKVSVYIFNGWNLFFMKKILLKRINKNNPVIKEYSDSVKKGMLRLERQKEKEELEDKLFEDFKAQLRTINKYYSK